MWTESEAELVQCYWYFIVKTSLYKIVNKFQVRRLMTLKISLGKALEDFQDQRTAKIVSWWESTDSMYCAIFVNLFRKFRFL